MKSSSTSTHRMVPVAVCPSQEGHLLWENYRQQRPGLQASWSVPLRDSQYWWQSLCSSVHGRRARLRQLSFLVSARRYRHRESFRQCHHNAAFCVSIFLELLPKAWDMAESWSSQAVAWRPRYAPLCSSTDNSPPGCFSGSGEWPR